MAKQNSMFVCLQRLGCLVGLRKRPNPGLPQLTLLLHIGLLMSWGQTDFVGDEIRIYRGGRQTFDTLSDLWHEMLHKVGSILSSRELCEQESTNRIAYAIMTILSENKWAADLICHAGMTGLSSGGKCKSCPYREVVLAQMKSDKGLVEQLSKVYRKRS